VSARRHGSMARAARLARAAALPAVVALLAGGRSAAAPPAPAAIQFTDVTAAAGITFKHTSGAFGKKYLPETMGAGGAFLDFDNDGWTDVFLVNSKAWPGRPGAPAVSALYRNGRDGSFTDVTKAAGLAVSLYGMGAAAADYDNDGATDLFVTALGGNKLFRNLGTGRFADVTAKAGVGGAADAFGTSAMFFDYDKDGALDLFVANYVTWSVEKDLFCTLDGKTKSYCTPESYKGQSAALYRNRGDGTFEDVTQKAGIQNPAAKSLGVALLDFDGDGWPDLLVANDTQPNKLYRNQGNGTFTDQGVLAGIAFGETGVARAGMGVDAADYSDTGRPSILIGNFSNEMIGLYHNEGNGLFVDEAPTSAVGRSSLLTLAFATFFFDYDLDGRLDVFAANGHVADDISAVQPKVKHAQPPHVFRNLGGRKFDDMAGRLGAALQRPVVARGAAYADYDNDGDLDVLMTTNNGPACLLRNDGGNQSRFLRVRLSGVKSNRDGIGAKVTVTLADGRKPWRLVHTGSSYCSQSELPLTFGLGDRPRAEAIEVAWPSGQVDRIGPTAANQVVVVREGKGAVSTGPLPAKGTAVKP
jgi:enediyne biosynthesis protein E4